MTSGGSGPRRSRGTELPPRVLVTRAPEDARPLTQALSQAGFEAVEVPLTQRLWRVDEVARAADAGPFDVVLLTSASAVDVLGVAAPRVLPGARYAAVGPATARRARELGYPVDLVPERATAADLVDALGVVEGRRVLYPRADLAAAATRHALVGRGAEVLDVVAYVNVAPPGFAARLVEALPVEATTVLSGSAVERVVEAIPPEHRAGLGRVFAIGPSTLAVAERLGLEIHAVADPHTVPGIVTALTAAFPVA